MAILVMSGQKSVTTAGTAVAFTTVGTATAGTYLIKALPGNTGTVYIGNDSASDVTSSNGFPLVASEVAYITVSELSKVYMDATADAQGAAWFRIEGENVGNAPPAA